MATTGSTGWKASCVSRTNAPALAKHHEQLIAAQLFRFTSFITTARAQIASSMPPVLSQQRVRPANLESRRYRETAIKDGYAVKKENSLRSHLPAKEGKRQPRISPQLVAQHTLSSGVTAAVNAPPAHLVVLASRGSLKYMLEILHARVGVI
ncbi:hypothetical protein MTO96_015109 [Rhipicephalus appendiculatus]